MYIGISFQNCLDRCIENKYSKSVFFTSWLHFDTCTERLPVILRFRNIKNALRLPMC